MRSTRFEWDPGKRASNLLKHGLDFEDARELFEGIHYSNEDNRKKYSETRYQCFGEIRGKYVVVVYTKRGSAYRIISLRKANEREKRKIKNRLGTR